VVVWDLPVETVEVIIWKTVVVVGGLLADTVEVIVLRTVVVACDILGETVEVIVVDVDFVEVTGRVTVTVIVLELDGEP